MSSPSSWSSYLRDSRPADFLKSITEPTPQDSPRSEDEQPITEQQRDRVLAYLQTALAQGRLRQADYETRVSQALIARTRTELNRSLTSLTQVPLHTQAVARSPLYDTLIARPEGFAPLGGRIVHWLGIPTSFVGPAIVYGMSQRGSATSREAARAFNFQLSMIAGWVLAGVLDLSFLAVLVSFIWFFGSIAGGLWAAKGDESRKLGVVTPIRPLDDGTRAERGEGLARLRKAIGRR